MSQGLGTFVLRPVGIVSIARFTHVVFFSVNLFFNILLTYGSFILFVLSNIFCYILILIYACLGVSG